MAPSGKLIEHPALPGLLLVAAAAVALLAANSSWADIYGHLLDIPVRLSIGSFDIHKPILLWINDGLMAVFFLHVGLELKREVQEGHISNPRKAVLPLLAALGGMAVPALIYAALNMDHPATLSGWAIPTATDIAFALGMLALIGRHVPLSLKVFLTALAVIDDLGAVIIIALFYTSQLSSTALTVAGLAALGLLALNRCGVRRLAPFVLVGLVLWAAVLKSGVHATLSGVVLALAIPNRRGPDAVSPLHRLEHDLAPYVAFLIMPVFAFANAGVSLAGLSLADLTAPVPLGIALGLFLGKQAGVMGACWLAIKSGAAALPEGANWKTLYGVALLTGIGFTMSLFIGTLAFEDPAQGAAVRIGVLGGSILSMLAAATVLSLARQGPPR